MWCGVHPERHSNARHFRRRQSNLAVMCKDTYLPGEDLAGVFLREMEMGGDSGVSSAYIPNV